MSIRVTLLLTATLAVALGGCGDDDGGATTPTTTGPVAAETAQAVWPAPGAIPQDDPRAVARSFVTDYVGVADPALSEFRLGEPNAGEVEVYRSGEDGRRLEPEVVVSVLSLRRLDGRRWSVTSAQSPEVELDAPQTLDVVSSPLRIRGRGRGFEGNVVLRLRTAFATDDLASAILAGGATGTLEPFRASLSFTAPTGGPGFGAVLVTTGSGLKAADGFGAFPVRFGR